jgi:CRISPR-associated endonuclease/helicase Cas3
VQQLTGTLRGLERDRLTEDPIFQRFLPGAKAGDKSAYLICTSAGEVGVNISGDHLLCDLSTFESIAQRFGRVNRFGSRADTVIHVVHPVEFADNEYDQRRQRTLELLRQLDGDASPAALSRLDSEARQSAFAPTPVILPASDILFDTWALTTIRGKVPGRPPVEPYLHGVNERDLPETRVAWREDVGVLSGELRRIHEPRELLEEYPLKPHEMLRDRSDRVSKQLLLIAERKPNAEAWLVSDDGDVEVLSVGSLSGRDAKDRINWRTVLLSPDVGGLNEGRLDGDSDHANDVADEWYIDGKRRRARVWDGDPLPDDMRLVLEIDTRPPTEDADESDEITGRRRYWRWYVRPRSADDDGSKTSTEPVTWSDHTQQVTANAVLISAALNLPDQLRSAIRIAARFHDLGKKRVLWQRSIGNPDPRNWLAKSGKWMRPMEITDYRHEFGSLVDVHGLPEVARNAEFQALSDAMKDVVLHLIAAHHGRARPHFPAGEILDEDPKGQDVSAIAAEIPRRFARLQRTYGRWGLAYLESILRAADYAASASPASVMEDDA